MKKTKILILFISLVGVLVWFLISGSKMLIHWCGASNHICRANLDSLSDYLFLFISILLFSIITYFLKEQVFKAWFRFICWYTPFNILVILFLSDRSTGGWINPHMFNSEFFAITLSGFFIIISTIIVIYKAISLKKTT